MMMKISCEAFIVVAERGVSRVWEKHEREKWWILVNENTILDLDVSTSSTNLLAMAPIQ